jgi:hypothetical protein
MSLQVCYPVPICVPLPTYRYVNATGLIWEQAPKFGALVVFAEHRYYGETQPVGPSSWSKDPSYLTTGQVGASYTGARCTWQWGQNAGGTIPTAACQQSRWS